MKFYLEGKTKSGKNSIVVTRSGHRFPTKSWAAWRDKAVSSIKKQMALNNGTMYTERVKGTFYYTKGDLIRRDVPGMVDAIFHALERAGVVKDDALIVEVEWHDLGLNRTNPGIEFTLERIA